MTVYSIWLRDVLRFLRQRSRVVGSLASPVLFWFVIGSGLGHSFSSASTTAGGGYLEYYFPGTVALIVLFTAIFSTISVIEDRQQGFLQGVLASPASRAAVVAGKVLGSATLASLNAAAFLLVAPLVGLTFSPLSLLLAAAIVVVMGIALSGLGVVIAWALDSTQGFHTIMNLLLVPMWLLSGALFPVSGAAPWVQALMALNPLSYGVDALRAALYGRISGPEIGAAALVMPTFAIATVVAGTLLANRSRV
jgi:ABC-2 type transport system permease protein